MNPAEIRLLMVEDSEDDEFLILKELERHGYQVTHKRVQTEAELSQALETQAWDLVISDFHMPTFSGTEALKRFKAWGWIFPLWCFPGPWEKMWPLGC